MKRKKVDSIDKADFLIDDKNELFSIISKDANLFLSDSKEDKAVVIKSLESGEIRVISYLLLANYTMESKYTRTDEMDEMLQSYSDMIEEPNKNKAELIDISNKVLDEIHVDTGDGKELSLLCLSLSEDVEKMIWHVCEEVTVHYESDKYKILSTVDSFVLTFGSEEYEIDQVFFFEKESKLSE